MRVLTAFLTASLLTACATDGITTGVITVDRPIPVSCVKEIPRQPPPPAIVADADIEQKAAWARIRDVQLRQYAAKLRATLIACQGV